jgi:trigger factor
MEIKELEKTELQRTFLINVSADELLVIKKKEIKKIGEKVEIQGFRIGKAPEHMVEAKYKNSILAEVVETATSDAVRKIYEDFNFQSMGNPSVSIKDFQMDKKLEVEVIFDLFPNIEGISLDKIVLPRNKIEITDAEIAKSLEEIAGHYKSYEDITSDKAAEKGDVVVIDFVGSIDGVEFEGGKGADFPLELGSNMFIPGFEDQLIGKKAGEKASVKVAFPKDYHAASLKGKDSVFEVSIKKLQKPVKKIDDELAKKSGFEKLEDLKKDIKTRYEEQLNTIEKGNLKKALLEKLLEVKDFTIPEKLMEQEKKALWQQFLHMKEHMKAHAEKGDYESHGHSEEEINFYNKPEEEIKSLNEKKAKDKIKLGLIFNDIAVKNNLKITDTDITSFLTKEAQMYGGRVNEILNYYKSNKSALKQLESKVMEDKIIDFILSKVSFEDKTISFEEYMK